MKTTQSFQKAGLLAVFLLGCLAEAARAGTVNLDFERAEAGVMTEDTRGRAGLGTFWNSVTGDVAGAPADGLRDENGRFTGIGVSVVAGASWHTPGSYTGANVLQQDSLVHTSRSLLITFTSLRYLEYRIVYFNDAVGISQTVSANGIVATCGGRTDPPPALPGVEGMDFVLLDDVVPNSEGEITVNIVVEGGSIGSCAGIQLQGWLPGEEMETAWRADVSVSRHRNGGYRGSGRYTRRPTLAQTVKRQGRRGARFFFRIENTGNACTTFSGYGSGRRGVRRRFYNLNTGRNVTADLRSTGNDYDTTKIDPGKWETIRCHVRLRRRTIQVANTSLSIWSPTEGPSNLDTATARLRTRR